MKCFMPTLAALSIALPLSTAGETLYVQSAKARLLASPQLHAVLVTELHRGDELSVIGREERWYKVALGNHNGWVSKLLLSEHAPMSKATALGDREGVLMGARRRASVTTTAGAARGLTADDRTRASQAGLANYTSLEKMMGIQVSEEEALAFLAEGLRQ